MVDVSGVLQFGTFTVIILAFVAVARRWGGPYPPSLSSSDDPTREVVEVGILFLLGFSAVTYSILATLGYVGYRPIFFRVAELRFGLGFVLGALTMLGIPAVLELGVRDRTLADLGVRAPENWWPAVLLVAIGALFGVLPLLLTWPDPPSVAALAFALYSPVLEEEFLYRGVIQTKLERVVTQERAWIVSGVLFGLSHVPIDFYRVFALGGDPIVAILQLAGQTATGLLLGLLFMKSRTLLAPILAHYLSNDLALVVVAILE
jgi:membrane protease YdiL (CAAX protease family)